MRRTAIHRKLIVRTWITSTLALALLSIAAPAMAGEPFSLFDSVAGMPSGSPPIGISDSYVVTLNLSGLELNPASVSIELPGGDVIIADRLAFVPLVGFDASGAPGSSSSLSDLVYTWRGKTSDLDNVILSVVEGRLWGFIKGPERHFSITRDTDQRINALTSNDLPRDLEDEIVGPGPLTEEVLAEFQQQPGKTVAAKGGVPNIQILVLYTEQARIESGGDVMDPTDDADLQALMYAAIGELNQAFENSLINGSAEIVHMTKVDFTPTGSAGDDLVALTGNSAVRALRDQHGADVVSVVVRNTGWPTVNVCGQAITQRPGCSDEPDDDPFPGCGPGPSFAPVAFHLVAWNCVQSMVVAHEFGHNAGCEHDPDSTSILSDEASFAWSFGHFFDATPIFVNTNILTIMALANGFREPYFSNPDVIYFAFPMGITDERDCAQSIDSLLPDMENFRPVAKIFLDNFESGDTSSWSSIGQKR